MSPIPEARDSYHLGAPKPNPLVKFLPSHDNDIKEKIKVRGSHKALPLACIGRLSFLAGFLLFHSRLSVPSLPLPSFLFLSLSLSFSVFPLFLLTYQHRVLLCVVQDGLKQSCSALLVSGLCLLFTGFSSGFPWQSLLTGFALTLFHILHDQICSLPEVLLLHQGIFHYCPLPSSPLQGTFTLESIATPASLH